MTEEERLDALADFCERQGWEFNKWMATQREPEYGIAIRASALLRATSTDSMAVVLARVEIALQDFAGACSDSYLCDPHRAMGRLR